MARHVEVLILGAGIGGLLLARELQQRRCRVAVAHERAMPGAGEAAVGLLNPVRGRRCTLAWRAGEAFDVARDVYAGIGNVHGTTVFRPVSIVRSFASEEERTQFERRADTIVRAGFAVTDCRESPTGWRSAPHGCVRVDGGGALDPREVVAVVREELRRSGSLIEHRCRAEELELDGAAIRWRATGIEADRVVLAGGWEDAGAHRFAADGLRPVRGESLLVRIPGLAPECAYVSGHHLAPVGGDLWTCGGTKHPGETTTSPTPEGRAELERFLTAHLAVAWDVVDHRCGVRASTVDTRPLLGASRDDPRVALFNGLGSQGFSHGPWLARLMAWHLVDGTPLPAEVNPGRFSRPPANAADTRWHAIEVAHEIASAALAPGDLAIDLTTGNGGDTARLALAVGGDGAVLGIDIQEEAIAATRRRLATLGCDTPVELYRADHAGVLDLVSTAWMGRVGAVMANLGHLPGSRSTISTRAESTISAFDASLRLLRPGGVLVAVINTLHAEGRRELAALQRWSGTFAPTGCTVRWHRSPDGSPRAPVVLEVRRHP